MIKLIILALILTSVVCDSKADRVENLAGFNNSETYSGSLSLPDTTSNLHYYFIKAQNSSEKAPIILWLQGGPGCSSATGLFSEIGPAVFEGDQDEPKENKWSWNNFANLLFIDSPVGVGYSYSADISKEEYNDDKTIEYLYNGLQDFFSSKFSDLASNDFWVSGESYSGIIGPKLAMYIDKHNGNNLRGRKNINLKGVILGSPVLNVKGLLQERILFGIQNELMDASTYRDYRKHCPNKFNSDGCKKVKDYVQEFLDSKKDVNPYDINRECSKDPELPDGTKPENVLPCVAEQSIVDYLNKDSVKEALHVDKKEDWFTCNPDVFDKYDDEESCALESLKYLRDKKLRSLFWGGETDLVVPHIHTLKWLMKADANITEDWHSWELNDKKEGYKLQTKSATFVTFKGIGHLAPTWNREACYHLVSNFVKKN